MKIFRTLFGGEHEKLEDCGDELFEGEKWSEASWFFREALRTLPDDDGRDRQRLERKDAAASRRAYEELLARSETRAEASDWEGGMRLLGEALEFAESETERSAVLSRRHWIEERRKFRQSADDNAGIARDEAARFHRELRRLSREEADRILRLGDAGRRGYLCQVDGDHAAARDQLAAEVAASPESIAARELLATSLDRLGLYEEARSEILEALKRDPDRLPAILELARLQRDRFGTPAAALEVLEQACHRIPPGRKSIGLHLERTILLAEMGGVEDALASLDRLLAVPGLDRGILIFNRAGVLEACGRFDEAIDDLRSAVAATPSSVLFLERLADLLFRRGTAPEEGLDCLTRALGLDAHDFTSRGPRDAFSPNRARLLYKIALFHAVLDNLGEAAACADEALTVCSEPAIQEAILRLRRDVQEAVDEAGNVGG